MIRTFSILPAIFVKKSLMLQRIQTLYLLLSLTALAVFTAYAVDERVAQGAWALSVVGVLTAFLQYKKRIIQMRWVVFSGVYTLLLLGLHAFWWPLTLWLSAPFAALILLLLAWRAIRADEQLVRSIDRIR